MDRVKEDPECNHVDKKGLTTIYKSSDDIKCKLCKKQLTNAEFRERVEYVAKCYQEKKPYV